jgi:hypothetical protein
MLSPAHVVAALEAKRAALEAYDLRAGEALDHYRQALAQFAQLDAASIRTLVDGIVSPGALPTAERVAGRAAVLPFRAPWENHQQARAWAMEALHGVTTVAVDGSQITPSPEFSLPLGAVQVGWFVNHHRPDSDYVKQILFEVLPPDELNQGEDISTRGFPDLQVNLRRFERECQQIARLARELAQPGAPGDAPPRAVCFLDGSLIVSFAAQMRPALRQRYVGAITALVDVSEATRIPVIGYIDTSYAGDLVALLDGLHGPSPGARLSDAGLLRREMAWGDRSEAWQCARDDLVFEENPASSYYERVHFLYLKTTAENAPARLDLPAWILEQGLLDWVVDVVRAECIVGTGYPYAVETADALAVITMQDRERFYRLCQAFLARAGAPLRYSRKAYSKRGRR